MRLIRGPSRSHSSDDKVNVLGQVSVCRLRGKSEGAEVMKSDRAAGSLPQAAQAGAESRVAWVLGVVVGSPAPRLRPWTQTWGGDVWAALKHPTHHAGETWAAPGAPQELSMVWSLATSSCEACSSLPAVPGTEKVPERCAHGKSSDVGFSFCPF